VWCCVLFSSPLYLRIFSVVRNATNPGSLDVSVSYSSHPTDDDWTVCNTDDLYYPVLLIGFSGFMHISVSHFSFSLSFLISVSQFNLR
jgi:hypothetical protein